VLADVASLEHAHKAVEAGADGWCSVAGARADRMAQPVRLRAGGAGVLRRPGGAGGGMSDGVALAAARLLGCDLGYIGTRFIATPESMADDDYRAMLVQSTMDDVLLTDIRSAGHSVAGVRRGERREIVERTRREYESAMARIPPDRLTRPDHRRRTDRC